MFSHPAHQVVATFAPLALAAAVFGCSTNPPPKPPPAPTPAEAPSPANPNIVGDVVLSTTKKPAPLGGVVYLDNSPKQPGALMKADIIIHKKEFLPFISVLTVGGTATFANTDTVDHHVFSPNIKGWDTGMLKTGHPVSRVFEKAGPFPLLCNIHPEMLGFLLVIPTTTYGKIDSNGTYEIGGVAPGTYQITAWVPRQPTVTKSVTVTAGSPATVDFVVQQAVTSAQ